MTEFHFLQLCRSLADFGPNGPSLSGIIRVVETSGDQVRLLGYQGWFPGDQFLVLTGQVGETLP